MTLTNPIRPILYEALGARRERSYAFHHKLPDDARQFTPIYRGTICPTGNLNTWQ